jgi:hypothetical protein
MKLDRRTVLAGAAASLVPSQTFTAAPDPVVQTTHGRIRPRSLIQPGT